MTETAYPFLDDMHKAELGLSCHPTVTVLDTYSMKPGDLPREAFEKTRQHLRDCCVCRQQVEDTQARAEFFRRQAAASATDPA